MSRIGKLPVAIPQGVEVKIEGQTVRVKGPKGNLERTLHDAVTVKMDGSQVVVAPVKDDKPSRAFHGLSRTLVANMVHGCSTGFSKSLTLVGVGYRAAQKGKDVTFNLGYSHPIEFPAPEGIELKVDKQTTILVNGASKELVGQVAAKIRSLRPPEPYHGKGVRYTDEHIATKVGKASGKK